MSASIILRGLPGPISLNNAFINLPKGGRAPSREYTIWQREMQTELMVRRPGNIKGKFAVEIDIERKRNKDGSPSKVHPDLDNVAKAYIDALVKAGIVDDDRHLEALRLSWSDVAEGTDIYVRAVEEA